MSLSDKRIGRGKPIPHKIVYLEEDVKKAVKELNEEEMDMRKDIISLIELEKINNYSIDDLIGKMKRLLKEHSNEKDEIIGERLI